MKYIALHSSILLKLLNLWFWKHVRNPPLHSYAVIPFYFTAKNHGVITLFTIASISPAASIAATQKRPLSYQTPQSVHRARNCGVQTLPLILGHPVPPFSEKLLNIGSLNWISAACLSLHPKSAGLLQLTSLQTAVVDYRLSPARAVRSGLVATWPRQFCTPDITLAAHSLLDTVQNRATHAQCTRWPVSGVHQGHRGTCCQ